MNQSFPFRKKYNLQEEKIVKIGFKILKFLFACLVSCALSLLGPKFCSQAPIANKLYSNEGIEANQFFYFKKKFH